MLSAEWDPSFNVTTSAFPAPYDWSMDIDATTGLPSRERCEERAFTAYYNTDASRQLWKQVFTNSRFREVAKLHYSAVASALGDMDAVLGCKSFPPRDGVGAGNTCTRRGTCATLSSRLTSPTRRMRTTQSPNPHPHPHPHRRAHERANGWAGLPFRLGRQGLARAVRRDELCDPRARHCESNIDGVVSVASPIPPGLTAPHRTAPQCNAMHLVPQRHIVFYEGLVTTVQFGETSDFPSTGPGGAEYSDRQAFVSFKGGSSWQGRARVSRRVASLCSLLCAPLEHSTTAGAPVRRWAPPRARLGCPATHSKPTPQAYHIYCFNTTAVYLEPICRIAFDIAWSGANRDVRKLGAGFMTEFGAVGEDGVSLTLLRWMVEFAQEYGQSW